MPFHGIRVLPSREILSISIETKRLDLENLPLLGQHQINLSSSYLVVEAVMMAWKTRLSFVLPDWLAYRATSRTFQRTFHSTPPLAGSPLLNLSGLSTSRESQYFSKERGIPRTRFSPHLELIESSEVSPFLSQKSCAPAKQDSFGVGEGEYVDTSKYLMKELESIRQSFENLKRENQRLERTVARNEAIASIFLSLSLLLGWLLTFPDDMKIFHGWTVLPLSKLGQHQIEDAPGTPTESLNVEISAKTLRSNPNANIPSEPVSISASQSSLSKFFWVPEEWFGLLSSHKPMIASWSALQRVLQLSNWEMNKGI